jgi:transcription elongation GreA/GreB family factor
MLQAIELRTGGTDAELPTLTPQELAAVKAAIEVYKAATDEAEMSGKAVVHAATAFAEISNEELRQLLERPGTVREISQEKAG